MQDQFVFRRVVRYHKPAKVPFAAQNIGQQMMIAGRWNPGNIVERRHDGDGAGIDARLERRQVDLTQRRFRNIGGIILHPTLHRAISREMFQAGQHGILGLKVRSLETLDARPGKQAPQPRILSRAFGHPAPTLVTGDINHGRKRPVDAARRRFDGRCARGAPRQFGIETGRLTHRYRENRLQSVNNVGAKDQRYTVRRLFNGDLLQIAATGNAHTVEQPGNAPLADIRDHIVL